MKRTSGAAFAILILFSIGDALAQATPVQPPHSAFGPLQSLILQSLHRTDPGEIRLEISALETRPFGENRVGHLAIVHVWAAVAGRHAREAFAVVWLDSALTGVLSVVDTFPTRRSGDYRVWLRPMTSAEDIVVCGEGDSFGDQRQARRIWLNATGLRADSVVVKSEIPDDVWTVAGGCGTAGYLHDD